MKKLLALVLALVMTLSLCTISNAAYSDAADIDYTEAVEVMSAAGILEGADGKFNPDGILTREQAAKIIAYMLLGKTAADSLSAASAPFADVAANRWSAGAIAYCASEGIIAGVGNNMFAPTDTLTGYQFCKMLLVALGYDASYEGFTGTDWQINVAKTMIEIELNDNLTSVVMSSGLTRQEAAQMALNAAKGTLVGYSNGVNVATTDGTKVTVNATRHNIVNNENAVVTFMRRYMTKLDLSTVSADKYGHPANLWSWDGKEVGKYVNKSAKYTWTANLKDADDTTVADALDGYTYAANDADGFEVYTNGVGADQTLSAAYIKGQTGNGVKVEVYVKSNVVYRVVVTNTVLASITDKDVDDKSITVTYGGDSVTFNNKTTNSSFKAVYDELYAKKVDDEFLMVYTASGTTINNILEIAEPTAASGKYTKATSTKLTVGGTEYGKSKFNNLAMTPGNIYELSLDKYGYVIGAKEASSSTTYAFVLDGSVDGTAKAGYTYNAKLLFTDGNVEWVEFTSIGNSTEAGALKTAAATTFPAVAKKFVSYTKNADGTYALTVMADENIIDLNDKDITKNNTSYNDKTVTNKTVYAIYNSTTKEYAMYTGIKNVPTTDVPAAANKTFGLLVSDVYKFIVVTDPVGTTTTDNIYVFNDTATGTEYNASGNICTYKAIVNGVKGTVQVQDNTFNTTPALGMKIGSTYKGDVVTTVGADTATELDAAKAFNKTNDADTIYKWTADDDACTIKVDADVLTFVHDDAAETGFTVTGVVAEGFHTFVVDTGAETATAKTLTSTAFEPVDATEVYFIIDADGYVAYAIIVVAGVG